MRLSRAIYATACLLAIACEGEPDVPEQPTWAHVEPILRAHCNHCHGSTARTTGASNGLVYRFDFYDVTQASCGEAAEAMEGGQGNSMARGWAHLVRAAITPPTPDGRARMPPAPASALRGWERQTLVRWAQAAFPERGLAPEGNRRPKVTVRAPELTNSKLPLTVIVEDPDGEAVVGVMKVANTVLRMDRAGAFSTTLDTAAWPAGRYAIQAVVCDGWGSSTLRLGAVDVLHDQNGFGDRTYFEPAGDGTPPPPPSGSGGSSGGATATGGQPGMGGSAGGAGAGGAGAGGGTGGAGGTGGSPSVDAAGTGGTPAMPDAGPGDTAETPRATGECADLDSNGTLDCKETLVKNPDFKTGAADWSPESMDVTLAFEAMDGEANAASGSLRVTNKVMADVDGVSTAGASQCLPVTAASYYLQAQIRMPETQAGMKASVTVMFYGEVDCKGPIVGFHATDPVTTAGMWQTVGAIATAPLNVKTLKVRLAVAKPFRQPVTAAQFDNVLLRAR